jgi:pyruvate,orthophosphate dikinase
MSKTAKKFVYYFGGKKAEGTRDMKALLGGKGANLAEMVNLGIPVPPGFTITTEVCAIYTATKGNLPAEVKEQIALNLAAVEKEMGRKFGDPSNPLLFSVRSGAAASMPGMMDTVLNLGLNKATVEAWVKRSPGLSRFVYDSYRRFITMYADVVMHCGRKEFEEAITQLKAKRKVQFDTDLTVADLKDLCAAYLVLYKQKTGKDFPQDVMTQLYASINAVFRSWSNERAETYRRLNHITGLLGTAVNIQAMVFGNLNDRSATGVAFSRSPSTGENFFYGEYLINAQGEDVVAGIRTPQQIGKILSIEWAKSNNVSEAERNKNYPSMEESMPQNYKVLCDIRARLEDHFRDMQDIEFTVEDGRLWMLQCRNAKRTMKASVRCALDMLQEKLITEEEAVLRVDPTQVDHLLHPQLPEGFNKKPIGRGLAASPGAAVGQIVFTAADAIKAAAHGRHTIMVRLETSPEDLGGMNAADGIFTARGGMTSHAAVVARGMGKTCVSGCNTLEIDEKARTMRVGQKQFKEFDWITLDGTAGLVYEGKTELVKPKLKGSPFEAILKLCHKFKRLAVRANADTPNDARVAVEFGAQGVGLCRTEHMFFEGNRIDAMREMILADTTEGRTVALSKVLPLQRADFVGIFRAMGSRPVTIRLLDPPLHEFVPHTEKLQRELSDKIGIPFETIAKRVRDLHEENPMLGHRGVRLGISYPEIYNMQVQAIIEAGLIVLKEDNLTVEPEIMIPLIGKREELQYSKEQAVVTAERVLKGCAVRVNYTIGTMIEVPRAAVTADQIAQEADFFSFGTNDLTQMGCGFSRDDSAQFLARYSQLGIYNRDPFQSIDQEGVGELIRIAISKGRSVKPLLKIGICGEHGGEPTSIIFCHNVGMNYVSCSPYRVPTAIVSAAHAALLEHRAAAARFKALAAASKL